MDLCKSNFGKIFVLQQIVPWIHGMIRKRQREIKQQLLTTEDFLW